MGKYLVGIDAGTTGCKTCVFDYEGNILGQDYREYPCYYPAPGHVEQKKSDVVPALFDSCKTAINASGVDAQEITAMALSTHGSTIAFVGENNELLTDFIVWQDIRGQDEEVAEIHATMSPEEFYQLTGTPSNVVTFSLQKLLWTRKHNPELWAKVKVFSTHHDYLCKEFGADGYYTDLSSASREAMMDVNNGTWSEKLHEMAGIRMDQRAEITPEPGRVVGHIKPDIAALTGLPVGCNICVGAHDQNCCTFGGGLVDEGDAVMVIGTFGSCFLAADKPIRDPKGKLIVKGNHGVGNYTVEAFSNTAASSFRWYRDVFCDLEVAAGKVVKEDPYNLITRQMLDVPIGSNGVVFLPFLQGAAGARLNYNAKGTLLGMDLGTTKGVVARAVLEGICFEMYDIVRAEEEAGIEVKRIKLTGGAAKSPFWCQMLADMMGKPIMLLNTSETGCLGAALYAGIGSGVFADCRDAVDKAVKIKKTYEPNPDNKAAYDKAFERWQQAYEALNKRFY